MQSLKTIQRFDLTFSFYFFTLFEVKVVFLLDRIKLMQSIDHLGEKCKRTFKKKDIRHTVFF